MKLRSEGRQKEICEKAMQAAGTVSTDVLGHTQGLGRKGPRGWLEQGKR